ncbi:MAG: hypothetical protein ACRDSH_21355 [Pseudonocardiaceae bacterium]
MMPTDQPRSLSTESPRGMVARLRRAYREEVDETQRSVLVAWSAFGMTFGITRALTYWLRGGHGPRVGASSSVAVTSITTTWASLWSPAVGAVALRGLERHRRHPVTPPPTAAASR